MSKAKVEIYNGEPAIVVDGKAFPPMTITARGGDLEYMKKLRDTGIRIFYVSAATKWGVPGDENTPDGTTKTLSDIKDILDVVPDAYIILRLGLNPSKEWANSHPEEQVLFNDGSHVPVILDGHQIDGMVSFASEKWREEGANGFAELLDAIKESQYADRVIGAFLCGGGTGEWYYPGEHRMKNLEKGIYADFSEPFRKSYSKYLKNKYGTEENLRKAWKMPDATFDAPKIPDLSDREYINKAEEKVLDALMNWESVGYTVGKTIDADARGETNLGVFLNAADYMYCADFFAALNQATADTIVHFAKVCKKHTEDFLVGAFYGYFGCTDYYEASHCTGTLSLLDCGFIDFLSGPGTYNNREPGGVVAQREMQDSMRIRNMLYICEDDARTHLSTPSIQREQMQLYSPTDSINTLKRDFARDICEDLQGWWIEIGGSAGGGGIYNHPDILSLFKRQQEIGELAYSLDRTKKNEIAIIYDTHSVHMVSDYTDKMVLDFFRTSDIHRIGAPVDYYFHDDMSNPDMPDYKLYVMLNTYCLTDAEREAVFEKARKNHATVLWMYAPGFIDPGSDKVLDAKNIEKTTGFKTKMLDKTIFPRFKVNPDAHLATSLGNADKIYGFIDRNVHSNIWTTYSELYADFANPGFVIDESDGIEVLGRYCAGGEIAYAIKERDGFVSAYCCTQVLRSDLIASLAKYSGCHIFTSSEVVLYAIENFLAIHASYSGKRTINFKKPCSPFEVYEEKYYARNVESLELDMKLGETKMFLLK